MSEDRVLGALLTVGVWAVTAKGIAVAKDVIIARQFGTNDALDAFLVACLLPQFAMNLIAGSLNVSLIPTYVEVRDREGVAAAQRLLESVTFWSVSLLVGVVVLLGINASLILPMLASGFDAAKLELTRGLFYLLLSTVVITGVSTIWGAVLNAGNRFSLVAGLPIVTSLVMVIAVGGWGDRWGTYVLAVAMVMGAILEMTLVGWGLVRGGVGLLPRWNAMSPAVRQVMTQYMPMIAGAFLMGGGNLISQSLATMLGPGTVSALAYGSKVPNLIVGVATAAVGMACLPHFSELVAREDWTRIRAMVITYSRWLFGGSLLLVLVLIGLSEPIIQVLFQRGAFTEADSHVVSRVQMMYALQIPPYIVSMLFVRLLSAFKGNKLIMWGCGLNLCATVLLAYTLMQSLDAMGIALATSLTYLVSLIFLAAMSFRILKSKTKGELVGSV